jgi:hypothetical protein
LGNVPGVVVYVKLSKEITMFYDHTNFQNIDHRRGKNDRSDVGSPSNHDVEVINPTPARNWAWAHHSDSYDWMDWHNPFPATDPSENAV